MRIINALLSISVLLLFSLSSALAAPPGGHLNIAEVVVTVGDPDTTLEIKGWDFDFGSPLEVTLAGMQAAVMYADGVTITATVPTSLFPAGDYLLTVSTGNGQSQNDEYDLTIGAIGPQGEQGLPGTDGATGDQGPQGTQGEQGIQGIQGKQGDRGEPGQPGTDGLQGEQGNRGEQGPPGPKGDDGPPGPKGDTVVGPPGLSGANCFDGFGTTTADCIGPKGEKGDKGDKGDTGPTGDQGTPGPSSFAVTFGEELRATWGDPELQIAGVPFGTFSVKCTRWNQDYSLPAGLWRFIPTTNFAPYSYIHEEDESRISRAPPTVSGSISLSMRVPRQRLIVVNAAGELLEVVILQQFHNDQCIIGVAGYALMRQ